MAENGLPEQDFEDVKDRTKLVWLGIGALILLMIGALWYMGQPDTNVSQVRVKHILISYDANDPHERARALQLARELRERIAGGESFEKLAREYSDDASSAARGGDLGYYPKGSFAGDFEKFAWNAEPDKLSDVISTTHGFHIAMVTDRTLSDADRYEMELEQRAREALDEQLRSEEETPDDDAGGAPEDGETTPVGDPEDPAR